MIPFSNTTGEAQVPEHFLVRMYVLHVGADAAPALRSTWEPSFLVLPPSSRHPAQRVAAAQSDLVGISRLQHEDRAGDLDSPPLGGGTVQNRGAGDDYRPRQRARV